MNPHLDGARVGEAAEVLVIRDLREVITWRVVLPRGILREPDAVNRKWDWAVQESAALIGGRREFRHRRHNGCVMTSQLRNPD